MKRRAMPPVISSHPNVTPLIDVVMCLIIFFMLAAKIGVSTGAEAMVIPATLIGTDIKDMGNTLTLNVRAGAVGDGDMPAITALVGGKRVELKTSKTPGGQLAETLKMFRYGVERKPGTAGDNPNFSVIIRGEEDLPYRFLEPVLMAASEANVKNVSFNTKKVTVTATK